MLFLFLIMFDLLCILDCIIKSSFLSYFIVIEFKIIQVCSAFNVVLLPQYLFKFKEDLAPIQISSSAFCLYTYCLYCLYYLISLVWRRIASTHMYCLYFAQGLEDINKEPVNFART